MLFTVGGAFSVWRRSQAAARRRARHVPLGLCDPDRRFVFEAASLAVAVRSLRRVQAGRSLAEFWRETRDPTLLTVLLEDTAALAAVVVAAPAWRWRRPPEPSMGRDRFLVIGVILLPSPSSSRWRTIRC
jgi:hypothetical protein